MMQGWWCGTRQNRAGLDRFFMCRDKLAGHDMSDELDSLSTGETGFTKI